MTVVAHNAHGDSSEVNGQFTTVGQYAHLPVVRIPEMRDSAKDEVPQVLERYSRDWNKHGWGGGTGNPCGVFGGCAAEDGFWHTSISQRDDFASTYVYWDDFGRTPLRGTYSVEFFLPEKSAWKQDGRRDRFTASAIAKYTIYERQSWSDDWRVVGYFTIDQGEVEGNLDTRSLSLSMNPTERSEASFETREYDNRTRGYRATGGTWVLEGDVRIRLQGKDGELAADSLRLVQRDLLPIDKEIAISRCQENVINVITKLGWIGLAVDLIVSLGDC
ncbi:MAG: hypothetical protein OXG55_03010 [bacterium]|nr:hypothetical protein [bacterium]